MRLPTGRQYRNRFDRHAAVAVELGGGLRKYSADGRSILDGYAEHDVVTGSRGLPLLPWPNRIRDGRYRFDGEEHQLPINRVSEHSAIHGLTAWVPWCAIAHTASRVVLGTTIYPQPGYPFMLTLQVSYELSAAGLSAETTARNDGASARPYGAGHHPYLAGRCGGVNEATLLVPATRRLLIGPPGLPTGDTEAVDRTAYDLRRSRLIGDLQLDDCYFGLGCDADGRARIRFEDTVLWVDEGYTHVMLFTGDPLPDPAERRRGLAVEPMTCPPDAFRTGTGVRVLRPGESVATRWGLTASPSGIR
ncbi:MAG TPA: aldose 1-epimerase family protein [bacterium]|nr:aldose 1-epimerase family protein [bacterium]